MNFWVMYVDTSGKKITTFGHKTCSQLPLIFHYGNFTI
jgi:hypothetical protein